MRDRLQGVRLLLQANAATALPTRHPCSFTPHFPLNPHSHTLPLHHQRPINRRRRRGASLVVRQQPRGVIRTTHASCRSPSGRAAVAYSLQNACRCGPRGHRRQVRNCVRGSAATRRRTSRQLPPLASSAPLSVALRLACAQADCLVGAAAGRRAAPGGCGSWREGRRCWPACEVHGAPRELQVCCAAYTTNAALTTGVRLPRTCLQARTTWAGLPSRDPDPVWLMMLVHLGSALSQWQSQTQSSPQLQKDRPQPRWYGLLHVYPRLSPCAGGAARSLAPTPPPTPHALTLRVPPPTRPHLPPRPLPLCAVTPSAA